jgi:hypothetical protein
MCLFFSGNATRIEWHLPGHPVLGPLMLSLMTQTEDPAEGLMAFLQKPKPDFQGKAYP